MRRNNEQPPRLRFASKVPKAPRGELSPALRWLAAIEAADTWPDPLKPEPQPKNDLKPLGCAPLSKRASELLADLLERHSSLKPLSGGRRVPAYRRSPAEVLMDLAVEEYRHLVPHRVPGQPPHRRSRQIEDRREAAIKYIIEAFGITEKKRAGKTLSPKDILIAAAEGRRGSRRRHR